MSMVTTPASSIRTPPADSLLTACLLFHLCGASGTVTSCSGTEAVAPPTAFFCHALHVLILPVFGRRVDMRHRKPIHDWSIANPPRASAWMVEKSDDVTTVLFSRLVIA